MNYPELEAFHKMISAMKNDAPIRVVKVIAKTEEQYKFFIKKEREYFSEIGFKAMHFDEIHDLSAIRSNCVYFTSEVNGNVLFITVDVSDMACPPSWVETFIKNISLQGENGPLKESELEDAPNFSKLNKYAAQDVNGAIANTLICHFNRTTDLKFSPQDLKWLSVAAEEPAEEPEEPETEPEEPETTRLETAEPEATAEAEPETTEPEATEPEVTRSEAPEPAEPETNMARSQMFAGAPEEPPVPTKKNNVLDSAKDSLSEEENERNWALLHQLIDKHNQCIKIIDDSYNTGFYPIKSTLQECVNKKVFNRQYCRIYMDISNDYTTELYNNLYELDQMVQDFHKSVVRKKLHLGCPNCGSEWDEDLTFLTPGIHEVSCPKCDMSRRIEV